MSEPCADGGANVVADAASGAGAASGTGAAAGPAAAGAAGAAGAAAAAAVSTASAASTLAPDVAGASGGPAVAQVGWYGKLPALGDFVTRRLPDSFRLPWDRWLCAGMVDAQAGFGEHWQAWYLSFPVWRFLWRGDGELLIWAGLLMPGVDRVGRLFPLTVAMPVARALLTLAPPDALDSELDALQSLALQVLEDDDVEAFDRALLARSIELPDAWSSGPTTAFSAAFAAGFPPEFPPAFPPAFPAANGDSLLTGVDASGWLRALGLAQWLSGPPTTLFWNRGQDGASVLRVASSPPDAKTFTALIGERSADGGAPA